MAEKDQGKLGRLLKQQEQLKAQIALLQAREKEEERKKETRRKILVGAAILAKVDRGEWPRSRLLEMMGQTLTRPDDRALFGLDGKAEDAKGEPAQTIQSPTTREEQGYQVDI